MGVVLPRSEPSSPHTINLLEERAIMLMLVRRTISPNKDSARQRVVLQREWAST